MKIKMDFITNSSSSSFLLLDGRDDPKQPIKFRFVIDFELMPHETYTPEELTPEDKVDLKNYYDYKDKNEPVSMFDKIIEGLNLGKTFHTIYASNDEYEIKDVIMMENGIKEENIISENIQILRGESYY